MLRIAQRTLRRPISTTGVGLHSGVPVTLTLRPADPGHGIVFVRTDLKPHVEIPARADSVVDTSLATTLGVTTPRGPVRIGTVEHLLAALHGLGVDNVRVEVEGPEVPIMDGSAAPFVFLLREAGLCAQSRYKEFIRIRREVEVREGEKWARLTPSRAFEITCSIDFDHPLIQRQRYHFRFSDRAFLKEVARARTFGFLSEVERLQQMGLARGGSLENAVVIDEFSILNEEGLRFADEFVRHKVLDALGDLALLGAPILGHLHSHKGGHALNHRLARTLLACEDAYERIEVGAAEDGATPDLLPDLGLAEALSS